LNPNDFYWVYNVKKHLRERKFLAEHKFTDDVICVACGWLEDENNVFPTERSTGTSAGECVKK